MARTAGAIAVIGVALLVWFGSPVWWEGLLEDDAGGVISWLVFYAVAGGMAVGLLVAVVRHVLRSAGSRSLGQRIVPSVAFAVLSLPALYPFAFIAGPLDANSGIGQGSAPVFEACVGWLAYVALAYVIQLFVGGGSDEVGDS